VARFASGTDSEGRQQCGVGPVKPSALKKQITIRLDEDTVVYFKALAEQTGIPY
jgi:uncharacterized protein (DUF4415 family)